MSGLLSDRRRNQAQQSRRVQNRVPPTHADLKYGPHERNEMDVWLADSEKPTPVLVSIHGGEFLRGNKSVSAGLLKQCLRSGISVAAITYRFSSQAIAPASFQDAARAVQFVRKNANQWNIDPTKVAATGESAGAGISLWLGFHDDLADPESKDSVLRQSTSLSCAIATAGQTSYDPRYIQKLFPESDLHKHRLFARLFDVDLNKLDKLPEEKYRLFEKCSPINHVSRFAAPAMLNYSGPLDQKVASANVCIHHARFGKVLKDKMDEVGCRCIVHAEGQTLGERIPPISFLKQEFGMADSFSQNRSRRTARPR